MREREERCRGWKAAFAGQHSEEDEEGDLGKGADAKGAMDRKKGGGERDGKRGKWKSRRRV
jgi:hypothetical protein